MILIYCAQKDVMVLNYFEDVTFIRFCFEDHNWVTPLPPDRIPYMDLTICTRGMLHYLYEGKDVYLKPGDAILFPQGSVRTRFRTDTPSVYCSFNVAYPDYFKPAVSGYLPNILRSDTVSILQSVRKSYFSVSDQKNCKCISLFWYVYHQLLETTANNEHPQIKHIKQYIADHLNENMTLSSIAGHVHLTPQYCCALFSKYMGQTLFEFIANQRIEQAKSLIVTTDMSLNDISGECGFGDYNYFSRVFRRITGIPASKYRFMNKFI